MVCMYLKELNIYSNRKSFIDLLSSDTDTHARIEGSVSRFDIQEINDMFHKGSIYLMTEEEADEYMALKREKEVREASEIEIKEEENNEECN